ncbi:DUF2804 domain-containing protein [Microlunatus panaciterrae]|uniref:DUF2804 domain-containing protein n=1 Tax=Microlunatus panaciterrae TaxID=400768 RepID=A0ABS2RMA4_9ACTN|nr:DUF2804 domain-containing protein [Microlunatus panaciterrae]MBM7800143.1 hypothetical protein [Microlunatus panaciterrae]
MTRQHEVEITEPVDLCLPDGRLNPAAVGWTRRPLHRSVLTGWGRRKRWEYWGIVSPSHIIGVTVSSLDYVGVHELYVLDRQTEVETDCTRVVPLGRGVELPERSGVGTVSGRAPGLRIDIDQQPDGTLLVATGPDVRLQLLVEQPAGHESLGVVVPWSRQQFVYTAKDVGRPVSGSLHLRYEEHPVPLDSSFAVLDHSRGRWPYRTHWTWAAGSGTEAGRQLAIQLGGGWTDGTGSTENALFVQGRMHKISEDLTWEYRRDARRRPWLIRGERLAASFHPFHERVARTNLGLVAGETHQMFGFFEGWASTDSGERVGLDGLVGWVEEADNRW